MTATLNFKKEKMQKNWYAVYTRPLCEKKIAGLFTKWKIENFCPVNNVRTNVSWRNRTQSEPLFKSYVFVHISESQISRLYKAEGVVSVLYWLGQPAVIKDEEIETIKDFSNNYPSLKVERTNVNINDSVKVMNSPSYRMEGKFISIKNKTVKVNLPSLGFAIIAELEKENIIELQDSLSENLSLMSDKSVNAI